jgi:hypothetical protein
VFGAVVGLLADAATFVASAVCLIAIGEREVAATRGRPSGAVLLTGPFRHERRLPDRPHRTDLAGAGISRW